ncbi:XRE family transcriptional regulator [uncultured Alsobacter sp.]|uniref:XRE family transcriptional regulator n=1 Tax=uncultured Alsobacter sp. TaxID=1748258 RepID=UPI0025FA960B|nr:XRE family transcriptional regulator [uncultured Alsobacter sp.]
MGRTLEEILATWPGDRLEAIERRFEQLALEVESLAELRRASGKAQADIAAALKIKQPSVSKIERQADMYLSTLRGYVEALGGELELIVRLPSRAPIRIDKLGDLGSGGPAKQPARPGRALTARGPKG